MSNVKISELPVATLPILGTSELPMVQNGVTVKTSVNNLRDFISVTAFGAVGDGVTDDTAAILAAVTTGQTVYIPEGIYIVSNQTFPAYVKMIGDGVGKTILKWKSASAQSNLINLSGLVNVVLKDITFDANRQNQTDSTGYYGTIGGTISNESNILIDSCQFLNGRITDIYFIGPSGLNQYATLNIFNSIFYNGLDVAVRACQAVALQPGIRLNASWNTFKQPTAPVSGRAGIVMQRPAGSTALSWSQVTITNNNFENFGRGPSNALGCIYIYSGSESSIIDSNTVKNSYGTSITVKADSGSTVITNNTVNGHLDTVNGAIVFYDQADTYTSSIGKNLIIANNSVYNSAAAAIFVDGERSGFSNFQNAVIANNVCDTCTIGIGFRNVSPIKVSNNIVNNATSTAISLSNSIDEIDLNNNTLINSLVAITVSGTIASAKLRFDGNQIRNISSNAIVILSSVNYFQIVNNSIDGCVIAFDTRGATNTSYINENNLRGESSVWSKSGSYGLLQYNNNITSVAVGFSTRTLTIASGVVTAFADFQYVDTESAAATDDLDTINGGYEGRRLVLFSANNGRDVTLKDGVGNLKLAGDFVLSNSEDSIELIFRSSNWFELSRSDNAA